MPQAGAGVAAAAAMAPSGTGGSVQEQQTSDIAAGLPPALLSSSPLSASSSPLSASALDAALAAQRSSARLVVSIIGLFSSEFAEPAVGRHVARLDERKGATTSMVDTTCLRWTTKPNVVSRLELSSYENISLSLPTLRRKTPTRPRPSPPAPTRSPPRAISTARRTPKQKPLFFANRIFIPNIRPASYGMRSSSFLRFCRLSRIASVTASTPRPA